MKAKKRLVAPTTNQINSNKNLLFKYTMKSLSSQILQEMEDFKNELERLNNKQYRTN